MKKTIAIICDYESLHPDMIEEGCGGSETWAIEISKEFARVGYNVMVFSTGQEWFYTNDMIQYFNIDMLDYILSFTTIHHLLITRSISANTIGILNKYEWDNNIYIVCHDIFVYSDISDVPPFRYLTWEIINTIPALKNGINKFIVMSEFGRFTLKRDCFIPDNKIVTIGNGLNFEYFDDYSEKRDNNIFWSSRYERGLLTLSTLIMPYVRQVYPDSKVYYSVYNPNELPNEIRNNPDMVYLGRLSKRELYREMSKHKVWFYPNTYHETFCITAIEEAMTDNEIVCPFRHGPATIFDIFENDFLPKTTEYDNENDIIYTSATIIERMKNYDSLDRKRIRDIKKKYIVKNYSWENIVKQYIKLFDKQ